MILEAVLQNLGAEPLETVNLTLNVWREIETQIGKGEESSRMRWTSTLKLWILQHFAGTLNLDLRRPLANYLAENFTDINSVDWHSVVKKPELAGHTHLSLRQYLSNIFLNTKRSLNKSGADIEDS